MFGWLSAATARASRSKRSRPVVGQSGRQDLERDLTSERQVLGEVHLAHATTAEEPDDPIMPEGFRNHSSRERAADCSSSAAHTATGTRVRIRPSLCAYASSCFHHGVPGLWSGVCTEHRR